MSRILDAVLDITLDEGYAAVTMQAVATHTGYVRPVVYDCYATPENMILAALDREATTLATDIEELTALRGATPAVHDPLTDVLTAMVDKVCNNVRTWALFTTPTESMPESISQRIFDEHETIRHVLVAALLDRTSTSTTPPPDVDVLSHLVCGIVDGFVLRILEDPANHPPERVAAFVQSVAAGTLFLA